MASASTFCPNPKPCSNPLVSSSRRRFTSFAFESGRTLFGSGVSSRKFFSLSTRVNRTGPVPISASFHTFDVVIVGAGMIGLTIARQFLIGSNLSVAVVDKDVPCSGATGAGNL